MMYSNSETDFLKCTLEGHTKEDVNKLCIYPECKLSAVCCEECVIEHQHNASEYIRIQKLDQADLIKVQEQKEIILKFQIEANVMTKKFFQLLDSIDYLQIYNNSPSHLTLEAIAKQLKFKENYIDQTSQIKEKFDQFETLYYEIMTLIKSQSFYYYHLNLCQSLSQNMKSSTQYINSQNKRTRYQQSQKLNTNQTQHSNSLKLSTNNEKLLTFYNEDKSSESQQNEQANQSFTQRSRQKQIPTACFPEQDNVQYSSLKNTKQISQSSNQYQLTLPEPDIKQSHSTNANNSEQNKYQNQDQQFSQTQRRMYKTGASIMNQSSVCHHENVEYLESDTNYYPGISLKSPNREFAMSFNSNGSLKVCSNQYKITFEIIPGKDTKVPYLMKFTNNGTIILQDGNNKVYFNSSNLILNNRNPYKLVLDNNGQLQILDKFGTRTWTSSR